MEVSYLKGKRVVVTGGAGVIGRELLALLSHAGANVLSFDRRPLPKDMPGISHAVIDLAADDLARLRDFEPHVILHLAAAFERSKESPGFWMVNWQDNTLLSHRVVDLARELPGLEVFVFASSYLIYSPSLYLSPSHRETAVYLKEEDPVSPRNLCGASKYYTEREIAFLRETANPSLRTICARIFRVYGCGSKDVVSRWVRASLSGQDIEVYNEENRFDYIFAADVAGGLLHLAASPRAQGVVNLGSGSPRSIRDVLDNLAKSMKGFRPKMRVLKGVREPFEASCADITKLKEFTGWMPPTSLEEGIKAIVDYEQNRAKQGIRDG